MELYIPPVFNHNAVTGRFLKGHIPHNKGKKWSDYLHKQYIPKLLDNLKIGRKGNPKLAGWNKRKVIGIYEGKIVGVWES